MKYHVIIKIETDVGKSTTMNRTCNHVIISDVLDEQGDRIFTLTLEEDC